MLYLALPWARSISGPGGAFPAGAGRRLPCLRETPQLPLGANPTENLGSGHVPRAVSRLCGRNGRQRLPERLPPDHWHPPGSLLGTTPAGRARVCAYSHNNLLVGQSEGVAREE